MVFEDLKLDEVNRALTQHECGGGKGVNVVRVLNMLGYKNALAGFAGGETGKLLQKELQNNNTEDLTVETKSKTRSCYTLICKKNKQATEIIEPSEKISPQEQNELLAKIKQNIKKFSLFCLSGSLPPGLDENFYAQIALYAKENKLPLILDACNNIEKTLQQGVTLLKINAEELQEISSEKNINKAAEKLLLNYPIEWLAVTDGAKPAYLLNKDKSWTYKLPKLENIKSAIGAGDCTAAIMAARLSESTKKEQVPQYFKEALAAAAASCLTDIPSVFKIEKAQEIMQKITVEENK